MILTKRQINSIKNQYKKAQAAEAKYHSAIGSLTKVIVSAIEIDGDTDHLTGDGLGFAPGFGDDHIGIGVLISLAEEGKDITLESIEEYLAL